MSLLQVVVLGMVQGITEFAPISSSAHLVIVPYFLGWRQPFIFFLVTLHLGTLAAIFCYFRRELLQLFLALVRSSRKLSVRNDPFAKLAWLIILGTIPALLTGHYLESLFEGLFGRPFIVGCLLLVTGMVLVIGDKMGKRLRDLNTVTVSDGLLIGLAQSLAIAPGISRSGITIATGLLNGLDRESAARFSFLLSFPAVIGAFVETSNKADLVVKASIIAPMILGFLTAAVSGYFCIKYLLRYLQKGNLNIFAYYCFGLGIFTIIFNWPVA